jgi:hypothetical protein
MAALLFLLLRRRCVVALLRSWIRRKKIPVRLESRRRRRVLVHPMPDVGLAREAAQRDVGRAGPHLGRRLRGALQQHHELVVLNVRGVVVALDDARLGNAGVLDRLEVLLSGETRVEFAVLVCVLVDLGVDDDAQLLYFRARRGECLDDRLVVKLVEATQQRVLLAGARDELLDRFVEVTREKVERLLPFRRRFQIFDFCVPETPFVGLAAGDATIEEHIVIVFGKQRLGLHCDHDRLRAVVEVLGLAAQRLECVFVLAIRLGREVVPQKTLHRMLGGAHLQMGRGLGNDRFEHLEPRHGEPFVQRGVEALHRKAEEALLRGGRRLDAERNGVHSRDRKHPETADLVRLEPHGALLALSRCCEYR